MQVVKKINWYDGRKPTPKMAIEAKMKVLREFYVVDSSNEREIRGKLQAAINANPEKDYELVLDRVAHSMIEKKLKD